ncbi:MAG: peptidylprolyl isomerase, partial [Patescibacteria group bacterium]
PIVQVNKTTMGDYRIIVELAGIKDVNEAIKMIGETPLLEFKEEAISQELTAEEQKRIDDFNKTADSKAGEILGKIISGGDFSAIAKEYSEDDATKSKGGDLGWITESDNSEIVSLVKSLKLGETMKDFALKSNGYEIARLEDKRVKTDPFNNQEETEVEASHILICYQGVEGCESGLSKEDAYKKIEELKKEATTANFAELAKANSTEPAAATTSGSLGWFAKGMMVKPFEDAVFSQKVGTISDIVETDFGYHIIFKKSERKIEEYKVSHILVKTMSKEDILGKDGQWKNTELTGKYLKRASVQFNPNDNSPEVSLEFDSEGAKLFEDITGRNIGKTVAIFLDGYAISVPTVNQKITGGQAVISGSFNVKEAKLLAQRLNAGALPVPITLASQNTVGASLGQQSIIDSLKAGIIGLILVAIFMIFWYRMPGLLSVFSLLVYGLLVLAFFKTMPIWFSLILVILMCGLSIMTFSELRLFNVGMASMIILIGVLMFSFAYNSVTLTLAGFAGFILSIGMAVDANILIFERMKDEIRNGRSLNMAIEDGFRRAWPSIRDGNITTIFVCFVLMTFGTGTIQGFGTTLFIGVVISMFSAYTVTRNVLLLVGGAWLEKRGWLVGAKVNNEKLK